MTSNANAREEMFGGESSDNTHIQLVRAIRRAQVMSCLGASYSLVWSTMHRMPNPVHEVVANHATREAGDD